MKTLGFGLLFAGLGLWEHDSRAQNVVEDREPGKTVAPIALTEQQARECIDRIPVFGGTLQSPETRRIQRKLNSHVAEFLEGTPWMPFHHTLGISGYESYFDHPDELFYTLSIALPFLSTETAAKAKQYLAKALLELPPYAQEGYAIDGRPRESYEVPEKLRLAGPSKTGSAFGVYAFWTFCHYSGDSVAAKSGWPAVKSRIQPLLEADYHFHIHKTDYSRDEAEKLNGDLAGLIGAVRLARVNGDADTAVPATLAVQRLLELRVNLERVNPKVLEKTAASKSLHVSKLSRYCSLAPEVADAVGQWSEGCGSARLTAFRQQRNGWHLAFGDRLTGGENYTNPLHLSRALFVGAVFVEQMAPEELFTFIDVPWCKGDLYFVEKCAYALWSANGRQYGSIDVAKGQR